MAKKFTMKAVTLLNFTNFIGSISPQEIAKIKPEEAVKASSRLSKIFDELEAANTVFSSIQDAFVQAVNAEIKKHQEGIDKIKAQKLPKAEEDAEIAKYVAEKNEEVRVFEKAKETELNYTEEKNKLVDVVINSDDRFTLLKEVFDKTACEKYTNVKAIADTSEALDTAVEA